MTPKVMDLASREGRRKYAVHGRFRKGQTAVSRTLPGFQVGVTEALEAE